MKIKFAKNAFGYKADQEIEVTADEAKAFGDAAVEVKVEVGDVVAKATDDLMTAVDAKIAAVEAKFAKAMSNRKTSVVVGNPNSEKDDNAGYRHLGEFAKEVKAYGTGHGASDRLKPLIAKAATTTETGATTIDGGATLPVGFIAQVFDPVPGSNDLYQFIDKMPISTRTTSMPVLKHYDFSNTNASNGVVASYISEGSGFTASKAQWETLSFTLKKLGALCPSTEELEEDSGIALGSYLASEANRQISETRSKNIMTTVSGGATCLLGHASIKKVLRNTVNLVKTADVLSMYGSFWGDYTKAVWVYHPTVFGQLVNMTSGQQNIFMPAGISGSPYSTLLGRPLVSSQYVPALGGEGDIGLYDFNDYKSVYRSTGIDAAMSPHLYFDSNQNAYRFIFRWDGKPGLTTTITLADGSTTVSPFVVLDDATT